jgi:hypothetical protein
LTVILEGMEEEVGGRGFMKWEGVLGGSMLGMTFFHDSTKAASVVGAAGRSVEKGLAPALRVRAKWREACRNMVNAWWWLLRFSGLVSSRLEMLGTWSVGVTTNYRSLSIFYLFIFKGE